MKEFHKVNSATGEIVSSGKSTTDPMKQAEPGFDIYLGSADRLQQYYVGGVLTPRPVMNLTLPNLFYADAVAVDISGLPAGIVITLNRSVVNSIVIDEPGQHRLLIVGWPYQTIDVVINAIETANQARAREILEIKALANAAILEAVPEWKQRNMTARGVILTNKIANNLVLSSDEADEVSVLEDTWVDIDTIRTASDVAESDGTTPEEFKLILADI